MALTAIHPGEHLAEELEALNMSAAALARHLKVPTNRITEIINGQRAVTGDTALRLAHFFGTSAEFWLNLQSLYELRLARKKAGKSSAARLTVCGKRSPARVAGLSGPAGRPKTEGGQIGNATSLCKHDGCRSGWLQRVLS